MNDLQTFYGPNAGYVLELYERYQQNPNSVDPATRAIFEKWIRENKLPELEEHAKEDGAAPYQVSKIIAASALAHAIRDRGHLGAHLDPLGSEPLGDPALLPETYSLTDDDPPLVFPETHTGCQPQIVGATHAARGV